MHYWLIANPDAGDGQRDGDFWQSHLQGVGITGVKRCDLQDQQWVAQVAAEDVILAAGGDGSVNGAAGLCLATGATLGVLPSGTANDFARNLGLPDDPAVLCQLIAAGTTRQLDVARLRDKLLLNVAHVGAGTWPARAASTAAKQWLGRFSYGVSLLRKMLAYRGFRAEIHSESGYLSGRWFSVAIANGAFYGGGNEIPQASVSDGHLDIIAVHPRSVVRLLVTFVAVRIMRRSPRNQTTLIHIKSPWCRVHTRTPKTVTADGEVMGQTPVDIRCQPRSLNVICEQIVTTT
ncbi:diacylglycerol/lipid kinase family protein [Marinobacter sp. X15-166B]|uniref:diacylglycerol/lipid kinase family protein n=1 Tax=Marinobacter sp. X15-166B TaxID=1897620 RepID=UPI00085BE144|nr:diacylglycerol kinase family protein [Marinobacter sp. X15-166B]OEY65352.1 diacylglycerol kinase [Marinobacter sp. X15-166B]